MDVFLVVRALDANYAPLAAANPQVAVDGGEARALAPTNQPGAFELQLPPGATKLEVRVDEAGSWPFSQRLTLVPGATPTLDWDGPQHAGARDLSTHQRGASATNVIVTLVLSHLRDARAALQAVMDASPGKIAYFAPRGHWIRSFAGPGVPTLVKQGTGWHRLNWLMSNDDVVPDGTLLVAERQTAPRLVAAYVPRGRFSRRTQAPVPYHVFFHPWSGHLSRTYPFHTDWVDLIARYLLYDPIWNIGKAMANQHHVAGKQPVFVFPVGGPTESFGALPKQANLLRLLQELNYWLPRMLGVQHPLQPVGRVAVSAFSAGAEHVNTMLASPHPPFHERHLREVYGFDLFRPSGVADMCQALRAWHAGGADGRRLRIYTTNGDWWNALRDLAPGAVVTAGASNSLEEETPSSTVLLVPYFTFFADLKREADPIMDKLLGRVDEAPPHFDGTHQLIPTLFMEHAVRRSSFADP